MHLSLRPPLARANEPDWLAATERVLLRIKRLADKHSAIVLCAGDIFDRCNAPLELVNWAIEKLPNIHAIPGNHDLPNHRVELAHKSAYGTLVRAGKITEVGPEPLTIHHWTGRGVIDWRLYGVPFGYGRIRPKNKQPGILDVALTHEFIWVPGCTYHGAPEGNRLKRVARKFRGFDVVFVGDNHAAFTRRTKHGTRVVNCGTPMRRKVNEADYVPRVWLLYSDGTVKEHKLPTKRDVLSKTVDESLTRADAINDFIQEFRKVERLDDLNFRDTLIATMERSKVSQDVRDAVMEAMDG